MSAALITAAGALGAVLLAASIVIDVRLRRAELVYRHPDTLASFHLARRVWRGVLGLSLVLLGSVAYIVAAGVGPS